MKAIQTDVDQKRSAPVAEERPVKQKMSENMHNELKNYTPLNMLNNKNKRTGYAHQIS